MTQKFQSYEFDISASLKAVFFNKLSTNMLKMVPIKFHSKEMINVGEISNYLAKL